MKCNLMVQGVFVSVQNHIRRVHIAQRPKRMFCFWHNWGKCEPVYRFSRLRSFYLKFVAVVLYVN